MTGTFDGYKPIAIVDTTQEVSRWVTEALAYARQECMTVGCTNYLRIAGHLALQEGFAADLQTLQSIFVKAPGFRLLDESSGWFTLADSEVSAAGDRLRKLMSVVVGSTDLDTIVGCMATDDRWLSRETGRALSIPPLHVMSALFAEWNWLMSDKHNKYWVGKALDPSIELSRTEYAIFQVIEGLGVATKADVMNKVVGPGISPMAVNFAIASSPAFFKIERAIYTLHGRPINADALVNARLRRAAETSRQSLEKLTLDLTRPIKAAVVQSGSDVSIDRRVVYLPKYLQGHVHGDFLHSTGKYGPISVALNQQIRHVAVVAETMGIQPREPFELTFFLADMTYEVALLNGINKTDSFTPVDNKQS